MTDREDNALAWRPDPGHLRAGSVYPDWCPNGGRIWDCSDCAERGGFLTLADLRRSAPGPQSEDA